MSTASPYIVLAAKRAERSEMEARAARFDAQKQWLQLKVLPHGMDGWKFALLTGPGMNQDSYICDQGFGFKSFESAKVQGEKAKRQRERGMEIEHENYLKHGRI